MTTKKVSGKSNGNGLKATINKDTHSIDALAMLNDYTSNCDHPSRISCEDLLLDFLGSNCNLIQDEIQYMKRAFLNILVMLAKPEVINSKEFNQDAAKYITRMILLLDNVENPLALAQMKKIEIEFNGIDEKGFHELQAELSEIKTVNALNYFNR